VHDEPRSELEQRALDAWTPAEPPADFADRVVRAAAEDPRLRAPTPASPPIDLPVSTLRWPRFAVAAVVAAAIAGAAAATASFWPARDTSDETRRSFHDDDEHRESIPLTPAAAQAPVAAVPLDLGVQIERHMRSYGVHHGDAFKFSGSVLVARDGELLSMGHYGRADIASDRPITADTRFKIGSLTQQFTAAAVLQLRDAGKLRLDDELRVHLPGEYTRPGVTIRHLLTHSSGIPNYTDSLASAGVEPGTRYTPQQVAAIFKDAALEFPPGSEFDPSNSGYFLLGMVVEKLSGQPLGRYLHEHIFAPAGMTRSALGEHTRVDGRESVDGGELATGYEFSEDELLVPVSGFNLSVYGGAAGMVSTPADLLRWDRALRIPNLLLSQASLDEMFRPAQNPAIAGKYGLGWVVSQERGQTMVGHPGGVAGFNGAIARYLGDGITILALANTEAIDCRNVLDAVAAIAHGEPVEPYPEPVELHVSPAMFSRYLGDFRLTPTASAELAKVVDAEDLGRMQQVKIYDDNGRLFMLVPTHGAKWMHGLGEDRFFFKDQAATLAQFGPPGAPVEWLRLTQGELVFLLSRARPGDADDAPPAEPAQVVFPGPFRQDPREGPP